MNCDKCGNPVSPRDDVAYLEAIKDGEPMYLLVFGARHIRCSPSRAQYIVHMDFEPVIDDRPQYDKRLRDPEEVASLEHEWTNAWIQLQKETEETNGASN